MFYLSVYVYEIMRTPVINSVYKTYIKFNGEMLNQVLHMMLGTFCVVCCKTIQISTVHLQFWSKHIYQVPLHLTS